MNFMADIAVIGDAESIKGFAAVGLKIFPCEDADEAQNALKKLVNEGCAVVYITEEFASLLSVEHMKEIAKLDEALLPAVIPIPGVTGNTGIGVNRLKSSVEKAVGSDIIFNK